MIRNTEIISGGGSVWCVLQPTSRGWSGYLWLQFWNALIHFYLYLCFTRHTKADKCHWMMGNHSIKPVMICYACRVRVNTQPSHWFCLHFDLMKCVFMAVRHVLYVYTLFCFTNICNTCKLYGLIAVNFILQAMKPRYSTSSKHCCCVAQKIMQSKQKWFYLTI